MSALLGSRLENLQVQPPLLASTLFEGSFSDYEEDGSLLTLIFLWLEVLRIAVGKTKRSRVPLLQLDIEKIAPANVPGRFSAVLWTTTSAGSAHRLRTTLAWHLCTKESHDRESLRVESFGALAWDNCRKQVAGIELSGDILPFFEMVFEGAFGARVVYFYHQSWNSSGSHAQLGTP